jgi:hypothetical protein
VLYQSIGMIVALAGKKFFQEGVLVTVGNNDPSASVAALPPCAAEIIVKCDERAHINFTSTPTST